MLSNVFSTCRAFHPNPLDESPLSRPDRLTHAVSFSTIYDRLLHCIENCAPLDRILHVFPRAHLPQSGQIRLCGRRRHPSRNLYLPSSTRDWFNENVAGHTAKSISVKGRGPKGEELGKRKYKRALEMYVAFQLYAYVTWLIFAKQWWEAGSQRKYGTHTMAFDHGYSEVPLHYIITKKILFTRCCMGRSAWNLYLTWDINNCRCRHTYMLNE